jgi:hypothetical protein
MIVDLLVEAEEHRDSVELVLTGRRRPTVDAWTVARLAFTDKRLTFAERRELASRIAAIAVRMPCSDMMVPEGAKS